MNIYEKSLALIDKLSADPSLLYFLVSMSVVSLALVIVYQVVKSPKR